MDLLKNEDSVFKLHLYHRLFYNPIWGLQRANLSKGNVHSTAAFASPTFYSYLKEEGAKSYWKQRF